MGNKIEQLALALRIADLDVNALEQRLVEAQERALATRDQLIAAVDEEIARRRDQD